MPLVLISLAVIILDRVTKILVQSHLAEGESIPVVPGVMSLTYILNPGAAFGMAGAPAAVFPLDDRLPFIAVLIYFWRRIKEKRLSSNWVQPFSWAGPWETSSTASKRALSLTFLTFIFGPSSMWPISLFV